MASDVVNHHADEIFLHRAVRSPDRHSILWEPAFFKEMN